jgi:hypothetical protein
MMVLQQRAFVLVLLNERMQLRHIIVFFLLALASRESIAAADSISVTVDTLCEGWDICLTDNSFNGGIARVTLIIDYQHNVELTTEQDPDRDGSFFLLDSPKTVCFRVNRRITYKPSTIHLMVNTKVKQLPIITLHGDSLLSCIPADISGYYFGEKAYNSISKQIFTLRNPPGARNPAIISDVSITSEDSIFTLSSFSRSLPTTLLPGEYLEFVLSFHAKKLTWMHGSLKVVSDCIVDEILINGTISTGIIAPTDLDFGELFVGESKCDIITIRNSGIGDFLLLNMDTTNRSTNNIFYNKRLDFPEQIRTSAGYEFEFCYKPDEQSNGDSLVVKWLTDIDIDPLSQMKEYSVIKGQASVPEVKWMNGSLTFQSDSIVSTYRTTVFHNHAPAGTFVKRFYISGKDSAEFSILNSLSPLSNVTMLRNETDWFDIAFKPDMTKPLAERYADRHATLVAELADSNVSMELIGTFNPLHVTRELALEDFSFSPNPVYGQDATLSFTLAEPKQLAMSIYDMLGREVMSIPSQYYSGGSYSNAIGTSKLVDGSYILRVSDGALTRSISFRVVR